jgi:hypothetical protein
LNHYKDIVYRERFGWRIYDSDYKALIPFVDKAYKQGIIRLDEEALKELNT